MPAQYTIIFSYFSGHSNCLLTLKRALPQKDEERMKLSGGEGGTGATGAPAPIIYVTADDIRADL